SKRRFPFKYVGRISGRKVSVKEFLKSVKDVRIELFLNYFSQPEALDKLQKDRKLINRLAWENLLIKSGTRKAGVRISDVEVIDFITNHPLFTRGGVFNEKFYKYFLKNSLGISPREFEENVRNFLITMRFREGIIKNVTVGDAELRRFYENEFEKAKLNYVVIDKNDFTEKAVVSEEEIVLFYNSDKERFTEPEKIVLQYIAFTHKEQGAKEKALAEMKEVYEKLRARPRNMEKIARRFGLSIKETPPFSQDEIVPGMGNIRNIGAVSFNLKPLAEVAPMVDDNEIGTSFIIMVKEKRAPRIKSAEEVTVYITGLIKDEKAKGLALKETDKLYEEAKSGEMTLAVLSEKHGLKLGRTGFISRFDYIEGIGESYAIVDDAFKLKKDEISKPIEVRKGYALIEPVGFHSIDEEKFEKEKDTYRNKVLAAKKMKALQDWFLKQRANSTLTVDLDRI
ncbi:MAG: SurA N-terminal domain-containing protein, partial [Candidatus Omnitrophota bacterium]